MIWVMTWSCDSVELVALELGHISRILSRCNLFACFEWTFGPNLIANMILLNRVCILCPELFLSRPLDSLWRKRIFELQYPDSTQPIVRLRIFPFSNPCDGAISQISKPNIDIASPGESSLTLGLVNSRIPSIFSDPPFHPPPPPVFTHSSTPSRPHFSNLQMSNQLTNFTVARVPPAARSRRSSATPAPMTRSSRPLSRS